MTDRFPNRCGALRRPTGRWLKNWLKDLDGCSTIWLADKTGMHHFKVTGWILSPGSMIRNEEAKLLLDCLLVWQTMDRTERDLAARQAQQQHSDWPRWRATFDWVVDDKTIDTAVNL